MISLFEDPELKEKEVLLDRLNKPILEESKNLNWFQRNFTNREEELRQELIHNWQAFNMWHDGFLRKKQREFEVEFRKQFTKL